MYLYAKASRLNSPMNAWKREEERNAWARREKEKGRERVSFVPRENTSADRSLIDVT